MSNYLHTYWRSLGSGARNGTSDRLLLALLIPFALIYSLVLRLRAWLYQIGLLKTWRLARPVISVGNITVGGTGKTPVTAWLARQLMKRGCVVAVLSRGYGGSLEGSAAIVSDGVTVFLKPEECGDEPYLLASTVPGLIVVIGSDRYQAGMLVMESLAPDIFLLDDGFQHIRLHRDMNILLLDCAKPFGNGWTLPAGLLREPRSAALRASWIIRTRCRDIPMHIRGLDISEAEALHELRDLVPLLGGELQKVQLLKEKKIIAFAGIAEPERFFDDLRDVGANILSTISLPDHASYNIGVIIGILRSLAESGADFAVTTEKDAVKLREAILPEECRIMVARLDVRIEGGDGLIGDIFNLLQKT